ncbi:MAG: sel1 repeat family protein [Proteobacteria bacterium]|nr:sel1 repeat family protein [Pseudomonadota bacterium]
MTISVAKDVAKTRASAASEWRSGRMSALLFRARAGEVETQFALAQIFESGHGVVIDDTEAARWYEAAARGGHVLAQFYLGQIYANGQGSGQESGLESRSAAGKDSGQGGSRVERNLVLAYVWWSRAARAGHEGAQAGLRSLGEVISDAELEEARGVLGSE